MPDISPGRRYVELKDFDLVDWIFVNISQPVDAFVSFPKQKDNEERSNIRMVIFCFIIMLS